MRTLTYMLIGLFTMSLLFVGSSFAAANEMASQCNFFDPLMVLGSDLTTPVGDYVGSIDDFAINPSTGQVDAVLVNDVRGLGAKVVAIPSKDISWNGGYSIVYHSPEEFGRSFDSESLDQLPTMAAGDSKFTDLLGGASAQSKDGRDMIDRIALCD